MKTVFQVFSLILALSFSFAGCSKPEPIALQLSAKSNAIASSSADVKVRSDCRSSSGQVLELCQSGVPVECTRAERGEYCTQYTAGSNGRMWGPF
ncbi:MAG: hypothetical protein RIR26_1941 [Pseudomonadota bacterium]|jgi:predicted small lipoprotein YifL